MKKVKRQPTKWEKTFANYVCGQRFVSKIYEEQLQLYKKKTTQI